MNDLNVNWKPNLMSKSQKRINRDLIITICVCALLFLALIGAIISRAGESQVTNYQPRVEGLQK